MNLFVYRYSPSHIAVAFLTSKLSQQIRRKMLVGIKLERDRTKRISKVLEKFLELKLETWILHGIGQDSGKSCRTASLCKFTFQELLLYEHYINRRRSLSTAEPWHRLISAWDVVECQRLPEGQSVRSFT